MIRPCHGQSGIYQLYTFVWCQKPKLGTCLDTFYFLWKYLESNDQTKIFKAKTRTFPIYHSLWGEHIFLSTDTKRIYLKLHAFFHLFEYVVNKSLSVSHFTSQFFAETYMYHILRSLLFNPIFCALAPLKSNCFLMMP